MFIVIEGLDGSGKSTQLQMLREYLQKQNIPYEYVHFPRTDTPFFGELIARFLRGELGPNDKVDPYLVAMLYAGDRRDAAATIRKWLNEGKQVIVDRYVCSNIAYQCAKLNAPELKNDLKNWILKLEYEYFGIPVPDVNVFLDVPMEFIAKNLSTSRTGSDRHYLQGNTDIHENDLEFQKKVRDTYLWLAQTEPTMRIIACYDENGMLPPENVFKKLQRELGLMV
ncbi:MAG TPA: dTMP kinase [Bacteroidales bacterium]|nr:dTMP kinase [Bacteroidales bacterium]HOK99071.1 dTMP kinase [Bacteroidales bacterium]HPO66362.1 dTMP kinase [Bacteroidales bacterium]